MFITFRLTSRRVLVITAAVIAAVLCCGAIRAALTERGTLCKNDTDRVIYLKQYGIIADPQPVWVKDTVISTDGSDGWDEYSQMLEKEGFDISAWNGKKVTVFCYRASGDNEGGYVRVLSCNDRVIGFDVG